MSLYTLIRPALFKLAPETAHNLTLSGLNALSGLNKFIFPAIPDDPQSVMGLTFTNPVGLAAGLDKNGDCINGLAALGFGFIEIGTVTPLPQSGNPPPRLFRLPQASAIINRMGFNNAGVDALIENVKRADYNGILGINIGKNATTPIENAADDYLLCLRKVYAHASYIVINISSPNTKNLRQLQDTAALNNLLSQLKQAQLTLADTHGKYVPVAVKIAPDMEEEQISQIARQLMEHQIDGVIATNTTLARDGVRNLPNGEQTGGLSGAPLRDKSTLVISALARELKSCAAQGMGQEIPIIGAGGILSGEDAAAKIKAGARLVQLYSGLIYKGPALIAECARAIRLT